MDNSLKTEVNRKIVHLLILVFPFLYLVLGKQNFLFILIPIATIIIATDYYRHKYDRLAFFFEKVFGKILRESEFKNTLTGASFMSISALATFIFFPEVIAIVAFTILAISDTVAALFGKKIKSQEFFEKTLAGSAAFFVSALLILIGYGVVFDQGFSYYLFGFLAVFVSTVIEARPKLLGLDDNLSIPLSFGMVMIMFNSIWVYNY